MYGCQGRYIVGSNGVFSDSQVSSSRVLILILKITIPNGPESGQLLASLLASSSFTYLAWGTLSGALRFLGGARTPGTHAIFPCNMFG